VSDVPSVEVTDEALGDVARQLDPDAAWSFTRLDMLLALEAIAARWPDLPELQGAPGRRYTADGLTVPLFHLLNTLISGWRLPFDLRRPGQRVVKLDLRYSGSLDPGVEDPQNRGLGSPDGNVRICCWTQV